MGDLALAERFQALLGQGDAGLELHPGHHFLAIVGVGNANDLHIAHA